MKMVVYTSTLCLLCMKVMGFDWFAVSAYKKSWRVAVWEMGFCRWRYCICRWGSESSDWNDWKTFCLSVFSVECPFEYESETHTHTHTHTPCACSLCICKIGVVWFICSIVSLRDWEMFSLSLSLIHTLKKIRGFLEVTYLNEQCSDIKLQLLC